VLDIPFDHLDLFQTVLEAAGVELDEPTRQRINSPGKSLFQVLGTDPASWRSVQFTEHGNARLVSDGRYKLVRRYPPLDPQHGDEFFDLLADPRETTNLIGSERHLDRIAWMTRALDDHFERFEVEERSGLRVMQLPSFNGREPWRRTAAALSPRE
jgi:arylsulfatase A-like enzyme